MSCNNLWIYNKKIELRTKIEEPIQKICNIENHLFILTSNSDLYEGFVEENEAQDKHVELSFVSIFKPVDIDTCKDTLFIISPEGGVLICNEQLVILNEINLYEEYKCFQSHNGLPHKVKVKALAVGEYGSLYVSENDQLWGSGYMPQVGIKSEIPRKVSFFSGRLVHNICVGADFAVIVVTKCKIDESETVLENTTVPTCQICTPISISPNLTESLCPSNEFCPLGVKVENIPFTNGENTTDVNISEEDLVCKLDDIKFERNIIYRGTEAAKQFFSKQISRMSSVGDEYLTECTEKPTSIIKQNMSNVATLVYEGVKTVGDRVATLSRHVSSSSDCSILENNNDHHVTNRKNLKEDFLISGSQSTSERDLSDIEIQEHIDSILNKGISLLNCEVWMWGNVKYGCLGGADLKNDLPVIISTLSNLGVSKISLQNHHACAITLDGRAFIWGQNNYHQVTLENNADQMTPKLLVCNLNERVTDAICGNYFTVILTNKCNVMYFGKDSQGYQTIYHGFKSEYNAAESQPVKPLHNLINNKEYFLLNLDRRNCDDNVINFTVREQVILEEMICVHQYVIRLLIKKASDSEYAILYDSLCKCYIDMLYFSAVSVESLLQHRNGLISLSNITLIRHFKQFIITYKNYVDVVLNIASINGFVHISKLVPVSSHLYALTSGILKEKNSNENDISLVLLSPLKRASMYTDFFRKMSCTDVHLKWIEFIEYLDTKTKEAEKTSCYWLSAGKNIDHLIDPKRRLICDSQLEPLNIQSSSRFSSHRFILFSDIFAHINGSSSDLHSLSLIWLELPHHDNLHLICLIMPEEMLTLVAPDGVTKNIWYHALQCAIKSALNKTELYQPPLARTGAYTFNKNGFFHKATYTGRWLNAKMHGLGKLTWSNGRTYNGQFSNNFLSGYGIMDVPNIGIYEGEWKENKQNGYGTFTYCNKDIYKGYFKDSLPHGHGLLRKGNFMANSASLYIGGWVLGKKSGYGVIDDISTGEKYLGCWLDCKKEGSGLIVTTEGTYYEGNFHNDLLLMTAYIFLFNLIGYERTFIVYVKHVLYLISVVLEILPH